jgi:competence protein ComEA
MKKIIVAGILGVLSGLLLAGAITFFVLPEKGNAIQIKTITPVPVTFHIDGEVNNPGVYSAQMGFRIDEAIEIAGGLTDQADVANLNLASKISDEDKIYIPQFGEEISQPNNSGSASTFSERININSATIEELCELSGIGESKAKDIISYRNENGKFLNIHDLLNVPGIGQAIFDKIEPSITIE